jgi:abequosyltransferase
MSHFLTFTVPTWKRPEHLNRCIRSIADQVKDDRVQILISEDVDDAQTTETILQLQSDFPFIRHITHTPRSDYSANFKSIFENTDGEWTWMFGDDDLLCPGALDFMLGQLEKTDTQFIHVSEATRASGGSGVYKGTLWTLANALGWIDLTGFITGNIVRSERLLHAVQTPRWRPYAKTAFVQSCVLLEELANDQCAFMDLPLVDNQDRTQTEETAKRWQSGNISGRYLYLADALELMYEDGILTQKVKPEFFRYLNYHLWNRYCSHFVNDYIKENAIYTEDMWSRVLKFPTFLQDEEMAKNIILEIEAARGLCTVHSYLQRNLDGLKGELEAILSRQCADVYPFQFVKPVTEPVAS